MKTFIKNLRLQQARRTIGYRSIAAIALSVLVVAFAGCSKDDDPGPNVHGWINFDGVEFEVTQGYFIIYPDGNENQEIGLLLMDDSFRVIDNNGVITDVEGSGDGMLIVFYSHQAGEISTGTYVFNNGFNQAPGHCIYASPMGSENDDEVYECTGGSIGVSRSGNRYEFEMALAYNQLDWNGVPASTTAVLSGTISGQFQTYRSEMGLYD